MYCNYFVFWLVHLITCVLCDWLEWLFWFWFYDTQLKTALTSSSKVFPYLLLPKFKVHTVSYRPSSLWFMAQAWSVKRANLICKGKKWGSVNCSMDWEDEVSKISILLYLYCGPNRFRYDLYSHRLSNASNFWWTTKAKRVSLNVFKSLALFST